MIERLLDIYSEEVPAFLYEIADSPQMQRLKGIGMNCGCEYTAFPLFRGLETYSRFTHSVGVGAIVWNFTRDPKQAIAALLHDVASPAFAHVIDFMKGDYLVQESTEERTAAIIASSAQICEVLGILGLSIGQVADYHLYPVADNDTPRLSADRLEYTMGNILNYKFGTLDDVARYYWNLVVGKNEEGEVELCFADGKIAEEFAFKALECGKVYVCDADRYSMQLLSEIVRSAIHRGNFTENLLYTTENQVIAALTSDTLGKADWERFRRLGAIVKTEDPSGEYPVRKISAKKRYIDPFVEGKGRVTQLSPAFKSAAGEFLAEDFQHGIKGLSGDNL
ncbi:MAG: hypothetical protein J6Y40_05975 [Bacteroidales bacterium]|nr:hypothetical protein [Bacteroidales bacterium]